jgi:ATP-dependent exoDNAse (exonuclease V) beta subunit
VNYLKERLGKEATATQLFPKADYPVLWSAGDQNWHESFEATEQAITNSQAPSAPTFDPAHARLQLAHPSADKARSIAAAKCFDLDEQASIFGTAVHQAFEQIEWLEVTRDQQPTSEDNNITLDLFNQRGTSSASAPKPKNTTNHAEALPHSLPDHCPSEVVKTLNSCFTNPEIRALFTKPETAAFVWRERAFSYVEGDQFTNGIFDRVVIYKAKDGTISHAEIIDFKSDRIHPGNTLEQASEHHRAQLEAYRKALAKILGIEDRVIKLKLVFSSVPQLVQL